MTSADFAACAELVEKRDPQRFRTAMTAPEGPRRGLLALYAFNAEISHVAWATREPGLAEIRLQYWHDQIEALTSQAPTDPHPVLNALRQVEEMKWLARADFTALITARRWDVWSEPFENVDAMQAYLLATGGGLMAMGARVMGMNDQYDPAIRQYGQAAALAAFFIAVPVLKARGRRPLPVARPERLAALAKEALEKLDAARGKPLMGVALPVLLSATEARPVLKRVMKDPERVLHGGLERAPFRQRLRAAACQISGRW